MKKLNVGHLVIITFVIYAIGYVYYKHTHDIGRVINIIFRYDDYSSKTPIDIELKIIEAFRKSQAQVTFGIIPFVSAGSVYDPSPQETLPLTSIKRDALIGAIKGGVVDIALHGYSHQVVSSKEVTEFSGIDYYSQVEKIQKGKGFLEVMLNVPVDTFIPPWNSYDLNTLHALENSGFLTISGALNGKVTESSKLNFLPATCNLSQLRDTVSKARSSADAHPVIVVLLHSYDFTEINNKQGVISYQEFIELLDSLSFEDDIRLLSVSQATRVLKDLSARRFVLNKSIHSISSMIPTFFQPPINYYADSIAIYWMHICFFYLFIFIICSISSFEIVNFLSRKFSVFTKILTWIGIIVSFVLLRHIFHDFNVSMRGLIVSIVIFGYLVGTLLCFSKSSLLGNLKKFRFN